MATEIISSYDHMVILSYDHAIKWSSDHMIHLHGKSATTDISIEFAVIGGWVGVWVGR